MQIHLFGGVEAATEDGRPVDVGPAKCQAVLAVLALSPRSAVPVSRLIELVWGDPEPDRLFARRWTATGLGELQILGSVPAVDVDELWVREQLLSFVREALELG